MKILGPYMKEGYLHVVFKYDDGRRVVQMYHRYLWEQEYGPLDSKQHLHHIDGNPLNNSLDNLKVMTHSRHMQLHNPKTRKLVAFVCPSCGRISYKIEKEFNRRKREGCAGPFCDRSCAQWHNSNVRYGHISG